VRGRSLPAADRRGPCERGSPRRDRPNTRANARGEGSAWRLSVLVGMCSTPNFEMDVQRAHGLGDGVTEGVGHVDAKRRKLSTLDALSVAQVSTVSARQTLRLVLRDGHVVDVLPAPLWVGRDLPVVVFRHHPCRQPTRTTLGNSSCRLRHRDRRRDQRPSDRGLRGDSRVPTRPGPYSYWETCARLRRERRRILYRSLPALAGTRRLNSSNQFCTTTRLCGANVAGPSADLIMRKRLPSGDTS
jgi:hypothetical protein